MKRILFFGLIVTILSSCGNSGNGELIGTQDRAIWQPTNPYGMVFLEPFNRVVIYIYP